MSLQPGQYNILMQRRADFSLALQFRDSAGAPIDLNGWAAYSQIWDKRRTIKYADFTIVYDDRADGRITLELDLIDTIDIPCEAFYDVLLEDPSGKKEYYLEGLVYVSEGYTEEP